MLTPEQLHAIMPKLPAEKGATLFPFLTAAVTEFGIEPPARTAAFLAQLAHESGQFRFMEEIWGPTPQQRRYEPPGQLATNLGNTDAGDGKRFKGRGPIQITGRANYRRFGDILGLNLIGEPEQAARPEVAFRIAALFWSKRGLNELADQASTEAFRQITRRINGGFNGLVERVRFYEAAKTVLGVTGPAAPADPGSESVPSEAAPAPRSTEDVQLDRGFEAIRSDGARRGGRKTSAKKTARKKRPAAKGRVRTRPTAKRARRRATTKSAPQKRTAKKATRGSRAQVKAATRATRTARRKRSAK